MKRKDHARKTDLGVRGRDAQVEAGARSLGAQSDATREAGSDFLDPYLVSSHPFVVAVRDNLVASYEAHLIGKPDRRRKMRAADRENVRAILWAILANLAKAVMDPHKPPSIAISMRKAKMKITRYDRPKFHRLPEVAEELAKALDDFTLEKSTTRGTASTLTASASFRATLKRFRFDPAHFAQAPRETTVWLVRNEHDYAAHTRTPEYIDYKSTPETDRLEAEMQTINQALRKADIMIAQHDDRCVFTGLRDLHRSFNLPPAFGEAPRFDLGGRLFGGWWQYLESARRADIRLDGEAVADLDFSGMFLRLAYLDLGLEPPPGDLYANVLPSASDERWRAGVKKVVNAMLFRTTPMTRLPKAAKELLPAHATGALVRSAILERHAPLVPIFETGAGYRLMFAESQILVAALLDLIGQGLTALLPMHDGIMVPASKAELARQAMQDAAEKITGYRLPVVLKGLF